MPEVLSRVKLKKSTVSGAVPPSEMLEAGEVALNTADGSLFYKNPAGAIAQMNTGSGLSVYEGETPPSDPTIHPVWFNIQNGTWNKYYGTSPTGHWVNTSHRTGVRVPTYSTFAACGDSITDRATTYPTNYGQQSAICTDVRGWAALLEQLSEYRIVGLGPTEANTYKTGDKKDRDHGYSGITADAYLNGDPAFFNTCVPIDDAIASDPDFFVVHIGTNDVPVATASVIIARIRAIWARLVATGKPVIGTDILQRAVGGAVIYNSPTIRDKIIEVNTALRAAWETDGLWSYRQWDDLQLKTPEGYADPSEYPDMNNPGAASDGIHPGANTALKMARDLRDFLASGMTGTPPVIPASGDGAWVTPNPYVAGGTTRATSWNVQFIGTEGVDVNYSKFADSSGDWQRVQIVNERALSGSFASQGVYVPLTNGGGVVTALIGTQIRCTARIRIPRGQNLAGVGISVQCVGASTPWTFNVQTHYQKDLSPIDSFDATIWTDPFTVPAGTSQIWFMIVPGRGTGVFEFQKAGCLRVP